ncbi:MAG: class I SAM-dependent methyltransferase [Scytolyngbya sp. HA4215-MV1]|nr:class I SAM-dependent methyltransferase [Scytolyngbya sp. HA4215-MV1]
MTIVPGGSFDKISPTALLTAYARQFAGIPYTREIAELTDAIATVNQFTEGKLNSLVIGLAAIVEGRYKAIEYVRSQFHATQILELASGLLPRGMILSQQPEITFIESDLLAMIHQKQQLAQQLIGDRPNLHFLDIDATTTLNSSRLSAYFHVDQPVTVLCEGLMMYLTFAEKRQVFANMREILQTFGGVWITPDLTTKVGADQMGRNSAAFEPVNQKISSLTGRLVAENEFADLDQARQFVREQGFQLDEFSMLEVLDQLESLSTLKIERDIAKVMLSTIPIFVMSLE